MEPGGARRKGSSGELEVAGIISAALGLEIRRNWSEQFVGGAYDLVGLPGWALEVKRAKTADKRAWWQQACKQAEIAKLHPALLYRLDGYGRGLPNDEKWQVIMPLAMLAPAYTKEWTVEMTLRAWLYWLYESGQIQVGWF